MMKVKLYGRKEFFYVFFSVFQEGVFVKTELGLNVRETIKNIFEISDEFIKRKISTILLDGKVVDDIEGAKIKEGSILALSGAMPGLVGATMRTHSVYESFREAITYKEEEGFCSVKTGVFTIKLFNILIGELVPKLLKKGIILQKERLKELLEKEEKIKHYIVSVWINGNEIEPFMVIESISKKDMDLIELVFLEATT